MKETYEQMLTYGQPADRWDLSDPDTREAFEHHAEGLRYEQRVNLQHTLLHALAWRCGVKIAVEEEDEGVCLTEARQRLPKYRRAST
jgi:hypothetical protein